MQAKHFSRQGEVRIAPALSLLWGKEMRATVFRQGRLIVDTLPDPVPQAGQVLVRTLACGICGTDLHVMRDGPHMMEQFRRAGVARALDFNQDIVFGHEFCCEIVDYGPSTTREFKPGTRVTALPTGIGHLKIAVEPWR